MIFNQLAATLIVLGFAGCGAGSDPLGGILNPNGSDPNGVPTFTLPFSSTQYSFNNAQNRPFSSSSICGPTNAQNCDGFDFAPPSVTGGTITAPAIGTVISIDQPSADNNTYAITIYHNQKYSSRIRGIQNFPSVQVGQYIAQGFPIAAANAAASAIAVHWTLNVSGAAICPAAYLSSAAKQDYISHLVGPVTAQLCAP